MSFKRSPSTKQSPNTNNLIDNCQRVTLLSNLFKVDFKETTKVYIFSVKTTPEIPQENSKKFRSLLSSQRSAIEKLAGPYVVSGRTIFGSNSSGSKTEIGIRVEWQNQNYHICLKLARQISLSQIYSTEKDKSGPVFSFLNNLLRNMFHELDYSQIGRSRKFFDLSSKRKLQGANVTLFKGYSSSFKLLQGGLYLRLDPAVKVIQSTTVLQAINSIYTMHSALTKTQKRMMVQEALIGKIVMANYAKNRCYVVEQVVFGESLDTYEFHDGNKSIKLLQYYKETYNIDVTVKAQPLLKASIRKSKNGENFIILIPQLMLLSGIPDDFDERKRKMVSDVTIVQPSVKLDDIQNIFERFSQNSSTSFSPSTIGEKLGINLNSEPTAISAKQLPYPELQLGDKQKVDDSRSTCFNLHSKKLFDRDVPLNICLFHAHDYDLMQVKRLMESTTRGMGLSYSLSCLSINFGDSRALRNIEADLRKEKDKGKTNLFWFIIPSTFKSQYKHIKRMTLREGIQINSQVTLVNTLRSKNFASIFTKVLLQMSAKIGNKLWVPRVSPSIQKLGVLVIGIQQTKDSQTKESTVVSYCCNTNKDFSNFHSNYIYVQRDKHSTLMKEVIFDCLNTFINANNGFPQEVILLKNGTAKSDFGSNIDTEVKQIKQILRSVIDSTNSNKLTYILLDKNPSQKFFLQKGRDIINPASGALINSEAVGKGHEFYLIAQQCNRGTVKPTYYRVVYSESTLEQGAIEELIYSQCFNYMNWSGAVKVPSVLQNAKKLGAFVGQYINTELKMECLQNNLYYI